MYFSFRIHVQTQTHTSVDLSFLRMRYGHLYGNAQWPFSSLAFSSLSHLCTVETKQRASTEGAQIRLFKWIGHYTGDAWGYRQKNTITWYLPAFLLSNHSFHLCSTLSAGIHFLRPQSWQITGGGGSCPKIISMEITLVTVFKPLVRPHLWVRIWHCEPKYMSKGNKSKGEGQKQKAVWVAVKGCK